MEKSYLEKIQIHKENKLAGLHPGAKLWMVILYTVCTFILNSIHLTEVGLSLAVIPWFLVVLILCATSGAMKKCVKAFKAVARGVETEGNIIVRAKAFFPTLVPLILGAVIGSEERVLTLEARGFSMQCEKTHMFNLEKSGLESTVKIASVVVTILVIAGRVALWIL